MSGSCTLVVVNCKLVGGQVKWQEDHEAWHYTILLPAQAGFRINRVKNQIFLKHRKGFVGFG
jgi:hypothetical protein